MTIYDIMVEVNNYFAAYTEKGVYSIEGSDITNSEGFSNNYVVGQYILIKNSILNDGIYKISEVTENVITVEETLNTEAVRSINIYGLLVPQSFINLATSIISKYNSDDYATNRIRRGDTEIEYNSEIFKEYRKMLSPYKKMRWGNCLVV